MPRKSELEMSSICFACGCYNYDLIEGMCPQCLKAEEIRDGSREPDEEEFSEDDDYKPWEM